MSKNRLLSFFLSLIMLINLIPNSAITAYATDEASFPMELATGNASDSVLADYDQANKLITISGNGTITEANWKKLAHTIEGEETSYTLLDLTDDNKDNKKPYGWQIPTDINMVFETGSNIQLAEAGFKNRAYGWFQDFKGTIEFNNSLDTSNLTDMSHMFKRASKFNADISNWDVSNVSNMYCMFYEANKFNADLSRWNVGKVTNMSHMFYMANEFNADLSSWNVSSVTTMNSMFRGASKFTSDLSRWQTNNVTKMLSMFYEASEFNSDLSNWNVSNVTTMNSMFRGANKFTSDLSRWQTANVTDMNSMFYGASEFNSDLSNWNVSNVTTMNSMFRGANKFTSDLSSWDVSNVSNMFCLFYEAYKFNADLSSWNVNKVTNMSHMFYKAKAFNSDLSNWNVSRVSNMYCMFYEANKFNADLSRWNVGKVTNASHMFYKAIAFNSDLSNWNVSNISNISGMFYNASKFTSDLSRWNVSNATNMAHMFQGARAFNADLSNWNVSNVTTMNSMFRGANKFTSDLSRWQTANVTDMNSMFYGASEFNSDLSNWNVSNVTTMNSMFRGANKFTSDLSSWDVSNVSNMFCMFYEAYKFNADLSRWNVGKVTNASHMFYKAIAFNSDLSNWNVSNISNISGMFYNASKFTSDLSRWNVSNATNMAHMFQGARAFNADLSSWNLANVTDVNHMFLNAKAIKNIDLRNKENSSIATATNLLTGSNPDTVKFDKLAEFSWTAPARYEVKKGAVDNQELSILEQGTSITFEADTRYELKKVDENYSLDFPMQLATGNADDSVLANYDQDNKLITISGNGTILENNWKKLAHTIEGGETSYTLLDLTDDNKDNKKPYGWQIPTDINMVFETGSNIQLAEAGFKNKPYGWFQDFKGTVTFNNTLDTSNLTDMSYMFSQASKFNDKSITKWNTSNVLNMSNMFDTAFKFNQDINTNSELGYWDVSNVKDMGAMFAYAYQFNKYIGDWDTSNVTTMHHMFMAANAFNQDISTWDTSKVTHMTSMFLSADSFNANISSWNTDSLEYMHYMFSYANSFNQDISTWNFNKVKKLDFAFKNATAIKTINLLKENTNAKLATATNLLTNSNPDTVKFDKLAEFSWTAPARYEVKKGALDSQEVSILEQGTSITFEADTRYELKKVDENYSLDFPMQLATGNDGDSVLANYDQTNKLITISGNGTITEANWKKLAHTIEGGETSYTLLDLTDDNKDNKKPYGWQIPTDINMVFETGSNIQLAEAGFKGQSYGWFQDFKGTIEFNNTLDTSNLTDMSWMFCRANNFNSDISSWQTNNVKTMRAMFYKASNFNSNLSNWQTGNVKYFRDMFYGASEFDSDLSSWQTGNAIDMAYMFYGASNFNSDLSSWQTANVRNMSGMFYNATKFNSDLSSWQTANVIDMSFMFREASNFNSNLSSWQTANVKNMAYMFYKASKFNYELSNWNVSNVKNMNSMFREASEFTSDLSSWNVGNVTNMSGMFYEASKFTSDLSNWDVSNVKDMYYMFYEANKFNSDLSSWDVSNVTTMNSMFRVANEFSSDLSSWNVSNVKDMYCMFYEANKFNSDMSKWNVVNVTNMNNMFYNAHSLKNINLSNRDNSSIATATNMLTGSEPDTVKFDKLGEFSWRLPDDYLIKKYDGDTVTSEIKTAGNRVHFTANTKYELRKLNFSMQLAEGTEENNVVATYDDAMKKLTITGKGQILSDKWIKLAQMFDENNFTNQGWVGTEDFIVSFETTADDKIALINSSNTGGMFENFDEKIYFNKSVDTSMLTDISSMFQSAEKFNDDISDWDISQVTNMHHLFANAYKFNKDISSWNTANVENMSYAFCVARAFNADIGNWNTEKVTNLRKTFAYTNSFNQDISRWNTANVENMEYVFYNTVSFNQILNNWNTDKVKTIEGLFEGARAFNNSIDSWNLDKVTTVENAFKDATAIKTINLLKENNNAKLATATNLLTNSNPDTVKFDKLAEFSWTAPARYEVKKGAVDSQEVSILEQGTSITFEADTRYELYKLPVAAEVTIDDFTRTYNGNPVQAKELEAVLNNPYGIKGSLSFKEANTILKNAGTYNNVKLIFTPDNQEHYTAVELSTTIRITKAEFEPEPAFSIKELTATYGQTLGDIKPPVVENANYTLEWQEDDSTKVGDVGIERKHVLILRPKNGNYNAKEVEVKVLVTKADFTLDVDNLSTTGVYGQSLSDIKLETDDYQIIWKNPAQKLGTAGQSYPYPATAKPLDDNYREKDVSVTVTVKKASAPTLTDVELEFKAPIDRLVTTTFSAIEVGLPSDSGAVSYTIKAINNRDGILISNEELSGNYLSYQLVAKTADKNSEIAIEAEMENYESASFRLLIKTVNKDVPELTLGSIVKDYDKEAITADDIIKEASFKGEELTGEWQFSQNLEDIITAGKHIIEVIFTADDSDNYAVVKGSVSIEIAKIPLEIVGVRAIDRYYQKNRLEVELTGGELQGVLAGDEIGFELNNNSDKSGRVSDDSVGQDKAVVTDITLTGKDSDNYYLIQPEDISVNIVALPVDNATDNTDTNIDNNSNNGNTNDSNSDSVNNGSTTITTTSDNNNNATTDNSDRKENIDIAKPAPNIEVETEAESEAEPESTTVEVSTADEAVETETTKPTISEILTSTETMTQTEATTLAKGEATNTAVASEKEKKAVKPLIVKGKVFADTESDIWYAPAVKYVVEKGLMQGTDERSFSPQIATTRAEIVTVLYRLENVKDNSIDKEIRLLFNDVYENKWYSDAIKWGSQEEIVSGFTDHSFRPELAITREQLVFMLYRYAQHKEYDVKKRAELNLYKDSTLIGDYAKEAMSWAVAEGLINGRTADKLDPIKKASRAEISSVFMRFSQQYQE